MLSLKDLTSEIENKRLASVNVALPKEFPSYDNLSRLSINDKSLSFNAKRNLSFQLNQASANQPTIIFKSAGISTHDVDKEKIRIEIKRKPTEIRSGLASLINDLSGDYKIKISCHESSQPLVLWLVYDLDLNDQLIGYEIDINVAPDTQLSLKEFIVNASESKGVLNRRYNLCLGNKCSVNHTQIATLSNTMDSILELNVQQLGDSKMMLKSFDAGNRVSYKTLNIDLAERASEFEFEGIIHTTEKEVSHQFVRVHHGASDTSSKQNHRILSAGESKGKFHSTIHTDKDIKNINAHQLSKNLLLSKEANIMTYPILEINTDDIQCSHGATIGMLNPEHILYLRSRGILEEDASGILIEGMTNEFFNMDDFRLEREIIDPWINRS
jgi:hypothetical protein